MVTFVIAAVGLLSYLAYITSVTPEQLLSLFTEVRNVIAWICAAAATIRYFFSDDWDETLPKVSMIVIDVVAGADLAVKAVMWLKDLLGGRTRNGGSRLLGSVSDDTGCAADYQCAFFKESPFGRCI